MESQSPDPHGLDLSGVDQTLREHLEPNPLTVERLVRTALREGQSPSAATPSLGWFGGAPRLALAIAVTLAVAFFLMTLLIPQGGVEVPPSVDPPPSVASRQPARVSISNSDGFVTISSKAGSKWILYSGDNS